MRLYESIWNTNLVLISTKNTFIHFHVKYYYFLYIGIGFGQYEKSYISILSVSADMKIGFIGDYRYRPIWKKPYRSYTDCAWFQAQVLDVKQISLIPGLDIKQNQMKWPKNWICYITVNLEMASDLVFTMKCACSFEVPPN